MNTTSDAVIIIAFNIIRAANAAAATDSRIREMSTLTLPPNGEGNGWDLSNGELTRADDGGHLAVDLTAPVAENSPFAAAGRKRLAATAELAGLLAELPFTGEALHIPLNAGA